jgi:hypothetical protein
MSRDEHCRRQQDILLRVIDVCRDDPHVLGLTVLASYSDAFSDLDWTATWTTIENGRAGASPACERARADVSVLYVYDQHGLYLFEDGERLDLTYKPPSAIRQDTATGARILHDRRLSWPVSSGRCASRGSRSPQVLHPW